MDGGERHAFAAAAAHSFATPGCHLRPSLLRPITTFDHRFSARLSAPTVASSPHHPTPGANHHFLAPAVRAKPTTAAPSLSPSPAACHFSPSPVAPPSRPHVAPPPPPLPFPSPHHSPFPSCHSLVRSLLPIGMDKERKINMFERKNEITILVVS